MSTNKLIRFLVWQAGQSIKSIEPNPIQSHQSHRPEEKKKGGKNLAIDSTAVVVQSAKQNQRNRFTFDARDL